MVPIVSEPSAHVWQVALVGVAEAETGSLVWNTPVGSTQPSVVQGIPSLVFTGGCVVAPDPLQISWVQTRPSEVPGVPAAVLLWNTPPGSAQPSVVQGLPSSV